MASLGFLLWRTGYKISTIYPFSRLFQSPTLSGNVAASSGSLYSGVRGLSSCEKNKMAAFADEKRKALSMSVEDKRKKYRCGNQYMTVSKVEEWPVYFKNNNYAIHKCSASKDSITRLLSGSTYKPDPQLNSKISVFMGDITTLEVDAVVNAANNSLMGGGGVDGAIHRAAGGMLHQECVSLGGCDTGDAKITGGYYLPARYIIHTVGPMGEKPALLESCYRRAMQTAIENNVRTMAFPCISTGVYGYPNEAAVGVVLPIVRTMLEAHKDKFDRIIFCLFLKVDIDLYHRYLPVFFPLP